MFPVITAENASLATIRVAYTDVPVITVENASLTTIRVAYTDVPVITAENTSLASIRRSANYTGNRGALWIVYFAGLKKLLYRRAAWL